jgi:methionyl-tRNA synthetase
VACILEIVNLDGPPKLLICVAWPYANGDLHIGHISGAYLPADIFARYFRRKGYDVLMVSGADAHGTPILIRAESEGLTPGQVVERYNKRFKELWEALQISFDIFTSTSTPNHRNVVTDFIQTLNSKGYLYEKDAVQPFDPERSMFLPDRYVEGTCPVCGYASARGDQCEDCGTTLDAIDLISPRSKLSGATPVKKTSKHLYFRLSKLDSRLMEWVESVPYWRPAVLNWTQSFIKGGLEDRAITRDLDWGIPLSPEFRLDEKKVYVWFEAVIGYLSATVQYCAQNNVDWRDWWVGNNCESYYFIGKDNVPFHTVIWPAMLIAHEGLKLPTSVPANNYILLGGRKASKSAAVGRPAIEYVHELGSDSLRYALSTVLPENDDVDVREELLKERINGELADGWGNLVSRVLTLAHKQLGGVTPENSLLQETSNDEILNHVDAALAHAGRAIERAELKIGLRTMMKAVQEVNGYLARRQPWIVVKSEPAEARKVVTAALCAISGIAVGLSPYLPQSSETVLDALGLDSASIGWTRPQLNPHSRIAKIRPLYQKLEVRDSSAAS